MFEFDLDVNHKSLLCFCLRSHWPIVPSNTSQNRTLHHYNTAIMFPVIKTAPYFSRIFARVLSLKFTRIEILKKGPPANCRLPVDRLEELQCYKFLQAIRQEDFHLIRELSIEGVPNIYDICEPKSGIFPLQLAVELNKLNVIDKLFELGCHPNTCDLEGESMLRLICGGDTLDMFPVYFRSKFGRTNVF